MKIALCLLTYDEKQSLEAIWHRLPAIGEGFDSIVAIDGGSIDGTLDFLKERKIETFVQERKGRGAALLLAFDKIEADAYLFFSPDGNEDPADIPRFKEYLKWGADLVIASRMMAGASNEEDGQIFRWRKWANCAFNYLANRLFRRGDSVTTDAANGFRAITKVAAQELELSAHDFTIEYQMTIRSLRKGLRIVEFPTCEGGRLGGETHAKSFRTGLHFLRRLWLEIRAAI